MKAKVIVFTLTVFFLSAVVCSADSPHMGTWKLNEAKSHFSKGATKNNTVVYEAAGDDIKVTVDGTDGSGAAVHSEWIGKFNGRDYAVTGSQTADMRSYRRINARSLAFREKKGGKVVLTGTITVTRNGKSRTVATTGKDSKGRWNHNTAVFDKQ
jgi:polyisoprenoid-binding protein YceI